MGNRFWLIHCAEEEGVNAGVGEGGRRGEGERRVQSNFQIILLRARAHARAQKIEVITDNVKIILRSRICISSATVCTRQVNIKYRPNLFSLFFFPPEID